MTPRDELLQALAAHVPRSPREDDSLRRTEQLVRTLPHPFDEAADPTHVTASAIVVDGAGNVLLHRHKRLGIWLQPGGHLDAGESPLGAALREVAEETGLEATPLDERLLHVDVHPGPRGHVHLDLRYLLTARGDAPFDPSEGESEAVAWVPAEQVLATGDPSLADAVRAAAERA